MDGIPIDLRWLGLDWDKEAKQSERSASYDAAAQVLRQKVFFILAMKPLRLDFKAEACAGRRPPPIYDRAAPETLARMSVTMIRS